MLEPVHELIEVRALERLKARYFQFWDGKDFEGWLSLFTPDATFEVVMGLASAPADAAPFFVRGLQEFRETLVAMNLETRTVHRGHTPEIELISSTEATGIWAMDDIIERKDMTIYGHGYYHETYQKLDGEWRFASVRLTRTRYTTISR